MSEAYQNKKRIDKEIETINININIITTKDNKYKEKLLNKKEKLLALKQQLLDIQNDIDDLI